MQVPLHLCGRTEKSEVMWRFSDAATTCSYSASCVVTTSPETVSLEAARAPPYTLRSHACPPAGITHLDSSTQLSAERFGRVGPARKQQHSFATKRVLRSENSCRVRGRSASRGRGLPALCSEKATTTEIWCRRVCHGPERRSRRIVELTVTPGPRPRRAARE